MKRDSLKEYVSLRHSLVAEKSQLEARLTAINQALNGKLKTASAKPAKRRRKMSAAARKKIAAAQKARWAKFKASKKS
jgi:hypothetical protein